LHIGVIIDIEDLSLELVIFLEVVDDRDRRYPRRVQVIMDDFRLSNFDPTRAILLIHDEEGIRLGECIHIREILGGKGKLKLLDGHICMHLASGHLQYFIIHISTIAELLATNSLHIVMLRAHAAHFLSHIVLF
jgi:hypothetical protein